MDDAVGVGVGERLAQVGADLCDLAIVEPARGPQRGERRPGDQLADQERAVASPAEFVESDDPGVVEARRCLRLAQDPGRVGGVDVLDRDVALEALVDAR